MEGVENIYTTAEYTTYKEKLKKWIFMSIKILFIQIGSVLNSLLKKT